MPSRQIVLLCAVAAAMRADTSIFCHIKPSLNVFPFVVSDCILFAVGVPVLHDRLWNLGDDHGTEFYRKYALVT